MRIRWTAGSDSCTPLEQNCGDTGREAEPGMESPVQAEESWDWQIRPTKDKDVMRSETK